MYIYTRLLCFAFYVEIMTFVYGAPQYKITIRLLISTNIFQARINAMHATFAFFIIE